MISNEKYQETILIVDDTPHNLKVLLHTLNESGFKTLIAENGERALYQVLNHRKPDLILLDMMMPGMDGVETCRRLKANPETQDIPVIFITALSDTTEKLRGFDAGGVDYVIKPFQQEEVLARIRTHLKICRLQKELQQKNGQLEATIDDVKMAALGRLVAGIAHEINTPIGIGVTAASHLQEETKKFHTCYQKGEMTRSMLERYIESMLECSDLTLSNLERAAGLIYSFKQVAVDQSTEGFRTFKVKEYTRQVLKSLSPQIKRTQLTLHVTGEECEVHSDPGAFAQIITNFITNSMAHAYDKGDSGNLKLDFQQDETYLLLKYEDDGKGIAPEHISKIFEAFFTTSRGKGGSGLGLNIIYNLVCHRLQGSIECQSSLGEGVCFMVKIPLKA